MPQIVRGPGNGPGYRYRQGSHRNHGQNRCGETIAIIEETTYQHARCAAQAHQSPEQSSQTPFVGRTACPHSLIATLAQPRPGSTPQQPGHAKEQEATGDAIHGGGNKAKDTRGQKGTIGSPALKTASRPGVGDQTYQTVNAKQNTNQGQRDTQMRGF
jgi:hypothetical protein